MRAQTAVTLVAVAALLSGCAKDPAFRPPVRPIPPPALSDPAKVIDALRTAYVHGDTNEIRSIYDDGYQGVSLDQNDPGSGATYFSKYEEIRHVAYLAHNPELRVAMSTAPVVTRFTDASDPPGWATVQNPLDSLSVTDASGHGCVVDIANDMVEFKFIPHAPDATSPTDTTWKIVRWTEIRQKVL